MKALQTNRPEANNMIKDEKQFQDLVNTVQQAYSQNAPTEQIEEFLQKKGTSLKEIYDIDNKYGGIENVMKTRASLPKRKSDGRLALESLPETFYDTAKMAGNWVEEGANAYSGGIYSYLVPGFEKRKEKQRQIAKDAGIKWADTLGRGSANLYGTLKSPIFKAGEAVVGPVARFVPKGAKWVPEVASDALGMGLYEGMRTGFETQDMDKALNAARKGLQWGGGISAGLRGISAGVPELSGLLSGLGRNFMRDVKNANSEWFKRGRRMTDEEAVGAVQDALLKTETEAKNALGTGKQSVGDKVINKTGLFSKLNKIYEENTPRVGMSSQEEKVFNEAKKYVDPIENIKKPTVNDLDTVKQNINAIEAPTEKALRIRTMLSNAVKDMADLATNGKYGEIMKPYAETITALRDAQHIIGKTTNTSLGLKRLGKAMNAESSGSTLKKVLGQNTYDALLGKISSPVLGSNGANVLAGGLAGYWGGIPAAAMVLGARSPWLLSELVRAAGKINKGGVEGVNRTLSDFLKLQ